MKKNTVIYIIITLLACALTGSITYILVDQKDNKPETKENNNKTNNEEQNNNESEVKQDGVKLLKTYNLNDKIIEEFEITLNDKTKTLNITFELENSESEINIITGKFKEINLLQAEYNREDYSNKEEIYSLKTIKKELNENNFQIIKGEDKKSYLVLTISENYGAKIYIFNDNLELISKNIDDSYEFDSIENIKHDYFYNYQDASGINIVLKAEDLSWYEVKKVCNTCTPTYKIFKIENNKIHYLALNIPKDWYENYAEKGIPGCGSTIEEREYTINNDILEYKVIKRYKVIEIANMI